MREKKLINKIGVAVYSVEEIENLLKKFHFDIVSIQIGRASCRERV